LLIAERIWTQVTALVTSAAPQPVFPLRKLYTEQNPYFSAHAQPCRHTTSEAFQAVSDKKFEMLQVRENEITLRN